MGSYPEKIKEYELVERYFASVNPSGSRATKYGNNNLFSIYKVTFDTGKALFSNGEGYAVIRHNDISVDQAGKNTCGYIYTGIYYDSSARETAIESARRLTVYTCRGNDFTIEQMVV